MPISLSTTLRDPAWDAFLQSTPLGQFQQSSMWAQVKQVEGWNPIRATLHQDGQITGGFQILQKKTRFGRIGYVSKGPILAQESDEAWHHILGLLTQTTRQHGLRALVLQLPDFSHCPETLYPQHRFLPNNHMGIIKTTLMVDTSGGFDVVQNNICATTRKKERQAIRRGITIRLASRSDLSDFFDLMLTTCHRQETSPNPSNLDILKAYWDAFEPYHHLRITLAECEEKKVAGLLCIPFGNRVNIWKKGWSDSHHDRHPNVVLYFEALKWICDNGFQYGDYAAIRPNVAAQLLKGTPIDHVADIGRDLFNLRFGGKPIFLPAAHIYLPSPISRLVFRFLGSRLCRIMHVS